MGFRLRRTPAKQQGSGSQGQPSPSLPDCERGAGCENGFCCFPEFWPVGAGVCTRWAFPVPFQTAAPRSSVGAFWETGARCWAAELGSGGIAGAWAQKVFARPFLLRREGEHVGSGFQAPETLSKAAGPKGPEAAQPRFAQHGAAGWMPKRLALLS